VPAAGGAQPVATVAQAPDGGGDCHRSRRRGGCRGRQGAEGRAAAKAARRGGPPPADAAVNADNFDDAHQTLLEIAELTTPFGTSTQRVAAYFGEAIICSHMICFLFIYLQWKISSIVLIFICKMSTTV